MTCVLEEKELGKNQELVNGLRELADYLEANPDTFPDWGGTELIVCCDTKDEMAEVARQHAPVEKSFESDDYFYLRKWFGTRVHIRWIVERAKVCRQVVTGVKKIIRPVYDNPVQIGEEEVEVEIKEWQCDEPLLSSKKQLEACSP